MARPKSEDKRNAILSAAAEVFAERGLGAATAAISSVAGVAEGTLFIYFRTKDELVNALYRDIKLVLADAMMAGFPRKKSIRQRLQHVWTRYVIWGMENSVQHRALAQIEVWGGLTPQSKEAGSAPFYEIQSMAESAREQGILRDLPHEFVVAAMRALAETTIEFMRNDPGQAEKYRDFGFALLWNGITGRR